MHNYILKTTSWANFNQTWNIASGLKEFKIYRCIFISITKRGYVHVIAKEQKHINLRIKKKGSPQKPHGHFHLNLALGIQTPISHRRALVDSRRGRILGVLVFFHAPSHILVPYVFVHVVRVENKIHIVNIAC